jgi:hypothetical protein
MLGHVAGNVKKRRPAPECGQHDDALSRAPANFV